MKKNIIGFILFFLSLNVFSQTSIRGVVLDKDTKKAIPDVIVQYGTLSKDYVYTDDQGRFSIPMVSENIIYFQCFGYKSRAVLKSDIQQASIIFMELNPVSLNPVVISPGDADMLLEEVMINTKKKLLTNHPIGYLLHFLQTKTIETLQNEMYLKYATTLTDKALEKNLKKDKVPYVYNLIDIRRLQRSETPVSELYSAEYHASHLFTFGKSINNETTRGYSSDSSLIILQIEPLEGKEGWAKGEVNIRKDDMTIVSIEIESVDSVLEVQPYKKYMGKMIKILRKAGRFEFEKINDKYYMKECYTYYRFRVVNEYGKEEDVLYHCDVNCIGR